MDAMSEHRKASALRDLGQPYDASKLLPEAWFPTKLSNPTKLQQHIWDGRDWIPTAFARFG